MRRALLLLAVLGACSKDPAPAAKAKDAAPVAAADAVPGPPPPPSDGYTPSGDKPANARRAQALAGMLDQAVAVGAPAPDIDLPAAGGTRFRLADALSKKERVLLVFYRGDW